MAKKKLDLAVRQEVMRRRQLMEYKGIGRPPKFVDPELVYHYACEGATDWESAARFGVTIETLRAHFEDPLVVGRARFTTPLRLKLVELAMSGNFQAMRLCFELYMPDKFHTKRGRWKHLPEEAAQRELLRFFSRHHTASAVRKTYNSRQTRRLKPVFSAEPSSSFLAELKRNTFLGSVKPSPWYTKARKLSVGWFGPNRSKAKAR